MKGIAGELPHGDQWVYELKWDGMRIIAHITPDGVKLQSSNGRDVSVSYPELQALGELGEGYQHLVLDGEVVAFSPDGKPSFNALQQRMHVTDSFDAERRAQHTPTIFVAFDLLRIDDHVTTTLPLAQRRQLLEQIVEPGDHWRVCEQHVDGAGELLDAVRAADLEGIMAKRADSSYQPGKRSPSWVKIKPRKRQEFVVGGWLSGRGSRAGGLGSLLVGYYDGDDLRFAGRAGSGLNDRSISEWQQRLTTTAVCPFAELPAVTLEGRTLHWCVPDHIAEIAFNDWAEGHQLRHPVVLGWRTDKKPTEVVRESF